MNKINYDALMRAEMQAAPAGARLLLHSCCGPCSSRCIEELKEKFSVTVLYYNPNITDPAEYAHRRAEQLRLLEETGWAEFLDCGYAPAEFFAAAKGLEGEPEGGARCFACYKLRLERTARIAKENGFDLFCSTLSVSPHKNAARLNEIGEELQREYGVTWLHNDFKKRGGYLRSTQLARAYDLYRQNYCGCAFSAGRDPEEG